MFVTCYVRVLTLSFCFEFSLLCSVIRLLICAFCFLKGAIKDMKESGETEKKQKQKTFFSFDILHNMKYFLFLR